ncbi:MAG: hypothetical protein GY765_35600, partial [bacterium]|nr:hypothetical protein [bacterium]
GHSLKATVMIARIHKSFQVKIPLGEIFKTPTIEGLAQYIKESEQETFYAIEPVEQREYYPASSAQKRMYLLAQIKAGGTSDNTPGVIELEAPPDKNKIKETARKLIKRHETLRTSFHLIEGRPVQHVHSETEFQVETYRLDRADEDPLQVILRFVRPFDLSKAPLFRIALLEKPEKKFMLMYDFHHIIRDGASGTIFVREFLQIYEGTQHPPLRIQYKD